MSPFKFSLALLVAGALPFAPAMAQGPAAGLTENPNGIAAVEFLDTIFNQKKVAEAFASYVGDDYIQHNPTVPSGIEAAVQGLSGFVGSGPANPYDFKRVIAEGDLVAVHSHVHLVPEGPGFAVVDVFRVDENGKIVEHWDVVQAVPETAANDNTMF
jgi:predicted SnoaL-like aldol condensation-catalyzing enzyme